MVKRAFALGLAVAALAGAAGAGPASASSHREAPLISQDPEADLNDLYAWVDRKDHSKVNLVLTEVPLEEAGDAPNYYMFGKGVNYDIDIDRNGDSRKDVTYRFRFKTHVGNGDIFLYNTGPVTSLDDPDLNVRQTYTVRRVTWMRDGETIRKSTIVARGLPVVPNNVGPRSMPSFPALVRQGVRRIGGGIRSWAGQTDDPFFLGLGQIGDLVNIKPRGTAVDTLRGYNTQAIALQVPKRDLVARRHPTLGIFADTQRRSMTNVLTGRGHGPWRTIERLGMPLTNEVLIGLDDKDRWNQANPAKDRQFDHYFLNPVLAAVLGAPATHRTDILTVFQTGVPKLNETGGPHADFLRLNTSITPSKKPSQLGVLGGDTSGFPNGRRLSDDVVDIELKVVAGALLGKDTSGVTDNVQQNDEAFEGRFPYLAIANPGLLSTHVLHHMAR